MDTVKQMDTALQKRLKLRAAATTGVSGSGSTTMSDSEKISLQLSLDAHQYGSDIRSLLSIDPMEFSSYKKLMDDLKDSLA